MDLMVDIDEVIFPMIETIHENARILGYHDGRAPMAWAGWENYTMPDGVTPLPESEYWNLWSDFALSGGYVSTAPIPGSVEALRRLMWDGHRIHLVTARGFMANADRIREWTPKWLEEFAVPHTTLTFSRTKAGAQDELGVRFNHAIDDSPKNYLELEAAGVTAWLHDHQHNWGFQEARLGTRVVGSVEQWAHLIYEHESMSA